VQVCIESDTSRRTVVIQLHEVAIQNLDALAAR